MLIQLDLFEEVTLESALRLEINNIRESNEKTRKSLFARNGELTRKYVDLQDRLAVLERNICKKGD